MGNTISTFMLLNSKVIFYRCPRKSYQNSDQNMDYPYFHQMLTENYVMYSSVYDNNLIITISDSE